MDERVKKYIFRIGSIVLIILICMFIILEIEIKKEPNKSLEETLSGAVNDIQENIIAPVVEENTTTENNIVESQSVTEDSKVENTTNKGTSENKNENENVPKTNTSNSNKSKATSNTKKETTTKSNTTKQENNNKKQTVTTQGSDERHPIKGDEGQWYTEGDWFELEGDVTFIEN